MKLLFAAAISSAFALGATALPQVPVANVPPAAGSVANAPPVAALAPNEFKGDVDIDQFNGNTCNLPIQTNGNPDKWYATIPEPIFSRFNATSPVCGKMCVTIKGSPQFKAEVVGICEGCEDNSIFVPEGTIQAIDATTTNNYILNATWTLASC